MINIMQWIGIGATVLVILVSILAVFIGLIWLLTSIRDAIAHNRYEEMRNQLSVRVREIYHWCDHDLPQVGATAEYILSIINQENQRTISDWRDDMRLKHPKEQ